MPAIDCGFESDGHDSGSDILAFFGPTLYVQIGFDIRFSTRQVALPELPNFVHPALIDTGATDSCIDTELARRLGLPVVDTQTIGGVGGQLEVDVHWAQIYIPGLNIGINGRTAGVHLSAGQQPHSVLIGRDFLQHLNMVYQGATGSVRVSVDRDEPWWRTLLPGFLKNG